MIYAVEATTLSLGKWDMEHLADSWMGPTYCGRDTKDMRLFGNVMRMTRDMPGTLFACQICLAKHRMGELHLEALREDFARKTPREQADASGSWQRAARARGLAE